MLNVKLQNGKVQVGGDFYRALAHVKRISGRKYDGDTKTWNVPQSMEEFTKDCGFPVTVLSGNGLTAKNHSGSHKTQYGNWYSENEWSAIGEVRESDKNISNSYADRLNQVDRDCEQALRDAGFPEQFIGWLNGSLGDLEDVEARHNIKWSSPARREQVESILKSHVSEWMAIKEEELEAARIAEEAIWERHGVE